MRGTETKPEQERRLMIRFYEGGGCNKALIVGYREVALVPTILIGLSLVLTGLAKCVETVMSERVTENMHRTRGWIFINRERV